MTRREFVLLVSTIFFALGSGVASAAKCDQAQIDVATTPVAEQNPARLLKARKQTISASRPTDVLIVGDSMAELWAPFAKRDFPQLFVQNFGVSGDSTQEILWRTHSFLPTNLDITSILLLAGTNNIVDKYVEPCGVAAGIQSIIDYLSHTYPSANIYVMPVLLVGSGFSYRKKDIIAVNDEIALNNRGRPNVRTVGVNIDEFACYGASKDCRYYMPDMVHPSGDGYALLLKSLRASGLNLLRDAGAKQQ